MADQTEPVDDDVVIPPSPAKLEHHAQKAVDAGTRYRGSLLVVSWMIAAVIVLSMITIVVIVVQGPARTHATQQLIRDTGDQITALKSQVTELDGEITALNTEITHLQSEIATREGQASKFIEQLGALVTAQQKKIDELAQLLQTIEAQSATTSSFRATPTSASAPTTGRSHGRSPSSSRTPTHHPPSITSPTQICITTYIYICIPTI